MLKEMECKCYMQALPVQIFRPEVCECRKITPGFIHLLQLDVNCAGYVLESSVYSRRPEVCYSCMNASFCLDSALNLFVPVVGSLGYQSEVIVVPIPKEESF